MPESTSADIIKNTASSKVIALPELMEHIGHHMHQSDQASCTLVSRSWNEIFTPLLWNTIDTQSKPWRKIMHKCDTGEIERDEFEGRCKAIFAKHGHLIRHLAAHWNTILEAASLNTSNCKKLLSFSTEVVRYSHVTPTTVLALVIDDALDHKENGDNNNNVDGNEEDDEQQPQLFPWVSEDGMNKFKEDIRHRGTVERFFILIRQNPGLIRLQFPMHGVMKDVSKEYVFETLSHLRSLKELNLVWLPLDIPTLLDTVPQLQRLQGHDLPGLGSLQHDYPSLRVLDIRAWVKFTQLLDVLKHLPRLEKLRMESVLGDLESVVPYKEACRIAETTPPFSQLRSLQVDNQLRPGDKYILLFLRLIPNLVRLENLTIVYKVKQALWEHCYYLDDIRIVGGPDVELWRERRAKDGRQ
ncbi:hypothetical protein BGZ97_004050 [Linnemannia gamsii]|uniref:F-box domain-containing protein n=1 Tax=Linnemannia gamsii TaxID=64522 RepID=A0A9P6UG35_9FUNG|nr:hypothetical protein BGZ97_004050 [Linnemannia gamsii]